MLRRIWLVIFLMIAGLTYDYKKGNFDWLARILGGIINPDWLQVFLLAILAILSILEYFKRYRPFSKLTLTKMEIVPFNFTTMEGPVRVDFVRLWIKSDYPARVRATIKEIEPSNAYRYPPPIDLHWASNIHPDHSRIQHYFNNIGEIILHQRLYHSNTSPIYLYPEREEILDVVMLLDECLYMCDYRYEKIEGNRILLTISLHPEKGKVGILKLEINYDINDRKLKVKIIYHKNIKINAKKYIEDNIYP